MTRSVFEWNFPLPEVKTLELSEKDLQNNPKFQHVYVFKTLIYSLIWSLSYPAYESYGFIIESKCELIQYEPNMMEHQLSGIPMN